MNIFTSLLMSYVWVTMIIVEGEISIVSGAYWSYLPETIMYQSSIPLVYISERPYYSEPFVPKVSNSEVCENSTTEICQFTRVLQQLNMVFRKHLRMIQRSIGQGSTSSLTENHSRKSRSVDFLGEALNWCCGVVTEHSVEPLFVNEEKVRKTIEKLGFAANQNHENLINVVSSIKNYSSQVSSVLMHSRKYAEEMTRHLNVFQNNLGNHVKKDEDSINILSEFLVENFLHNLNTLQIFNDYEVMSGCRDNKIPTEIVEPFVLKADLEKLDKTLKISGHELVIKPTEVTKYLRLGIATCIATENAITVTIRLPVRKLDYEWKLYRLLSVPFAWKSETCVFTEDEVLIAKHNSEIKILTGNALRNCDVKNNMCLLPRSSSTTVKDTACFINLAMGAEISDLVETCKPFCFANNNTIVNQVEPEKFIVSHPPESMLLKCNDKVEKISVTHDSQLGAVEIEVPCFCSLQIPELQYLVAETFPCDAKSIDKFEIRHVLPATWSKFESFKIKPMTTHTHLTFENFSECLNHNWKKVIPQFIVQNQRIEKNNTYDFENLELEQFPWREVHTYGMNFLQVFNLIATFLIVIIIMRNPYLIGIGTFPKVEASDSKDILISINAISIIMVFGLFISWLIYYYCLKSNHAKSDVENVLTYEEKKEQRENRQIRRKKENMNRKKNSEEAISQES